MSQPITSRATAGDVRARVTVAVPPVCGEPLVAVRPEQFGGSTERVYYSLGGYPIGFVYPSTVVGGYLAEVSNEQGASGLNGLLIGLGMPSLRHAPDKEPPLSFADVAAEFEWRLERHGWTFVDAVPC